MIECLVKLLLLICGETYGIFLKESKITNSNICLLSKLLKYSWIRSQSQQLKSQGV